MMKVTFVGIILFIFVSSAISQTTLSLLNGQQKTLDSFVFRSDDGIDYIEYSLKKDNGKIKTSYTDAEDIYSMKINGRDSIFYNPTEDGEFSLPQMTQVVTARQLAIKEYNPWWSFATGMVVGCGSMFLPTDGLTKMLVPIAYTVGMGFAKPRKSYITKHYDYATGDEWFIYGYQNAGRKKIFNKTLLGEIGGIFIAGAITGTLYFINGAE